jgi:hypothetical protein
MLLIIFSLVAAAVFKIALVFFAFAAINLRFASSVMGRLD